VRVKFAFKYNVPDAVFKNPIPIEIIKRQTLIVEGQGIRK
jgi:hypothetical protein